MIRRATAADADVIADLGIVVNAKNPMEYSEEDGRQALRSLLGNDHVASFVSDIGGKIDAACCVGLVPLFWAPADIVAHVVFWWGVSPRASLRVFKEACRWAKVKGATRLVSAARDERVARLHARMGLEQVELVFERRL